MPQTTDSIANPWQPQVCREPDAPSSAREQLGMTLGKVPYTFGEEPDARTLLPGYDSGVLSLVIGIFLLLAYNSRHYSTFLKHFWSDLWSVRKRDDTFSVRTFSETGMLVSIVMLSSICEGIIINSAITRYYGTTFLNTLAEIVLFSIAAALYYLWEVAAYRTVGFVFTDKFTSRQWLKGFNASQVLLGLSMTIPALFVLFNPDAAPIVVPMGAAIYVICRLLFICKGFRLFYDNFGSLLYFILYLCTLEIVPLVVIYRGVLFLTSLNPKL
ncbi:MAG: DUF4271 domain-containing protein [Duncaniella sp.]|nr:DUF4271 domain-containing protein [Duncaniella sp.]MDE6859907.1 DUF4271 domain-containing protein [Duncaniella sp.]